MRTKKHEEEIVTEVFLNAFNEKYKTHYRTHIVDSELTRIDTQGISPVPGELPLNIQVTYADNGMPHEGGSILSRKFNPKTNIIDLTTPYDIAAAIERKQSRYETEVSRDLILLIWKTKSCLVDPRGMGWNESGIEFRACYFVCLPGSGTPGQVITLKPLRDESGNVYEITT
jgi:hypothetical protein